MQISIPKELEPLKARKQWVLWRLEENDTGKITKPPYSAVTGQKAESDNPATWATFDQVQKVLELDTNGFFGGIGIMFGNGLFGVDIDHCVDPTGRISDQTAAAIVATADSYTEFSPSGTGVHVLMYSEKPGGGCKRHISDPIDGSNDVAAEIYYTGRYFTVTGRPYGNPKPIQERTAQGAAIRAMIMQAGENLKAKRQQPPQTAQQAPQQPQQAAQPGGYAADSDLIAAMFRSQHGGAIYALWNCDLTAYGNDHSRADQALCNHLAYWTNGDHDRMDRLFRQSGLMREKWDSQRGADTYGGMTIQNALKTFKPYTGPAQSSAAADFSGITGTTQQPAAPALDVPLFPGAPTMDNPKPDSVSRYLSEGMDSDVSRFKQYKDRRSGFYNLDEETTLYPGLYVLGAVSSLGKTTFVLQIADHLAASGEHVLYFALEQSRMELTAKSLSRMTADIALEGCQMGPNDTGSILGFFDPKERGAVSAIAIRGGYNPQIVQQARRRYQQTIGDRMSVIECNFDTTIEAILDYIKRYMEVNKTRPIVVIDYLQIIPASDPRQDERRKTDHIIRGLKKLQADYNLLMFVVSSLNRGSYLSPIDFESFKESGLIEYSCDVLWGLQLRAIHSDIFDKENKIKKKREVLRRAKAEIPRAVELVCLKNRYGRSSYSCNFDYDPRHDIFAPAIGLPEYE